MNIITAIVILLFVYPIQAQTNTYNIEKANAWEDLQTYLPEAKMAGTSVLVSLLPPSECPPRNPSGNYSEPYQLDYVTWAKKIAELSLRYSNLKGYGIKNLQENLDLGYLTQNYINNVKAAGTAINPKLQFIIQDNSTNYYVDKNAKGNGSGSSWTNAAIKLSALNWANIGKEPNDTVYISGGKDSTVYGQDSLVAKCTYEVIITNAKESGYNGKVIISSSTPHTKFPIGFTFCINNSTNLKFVNLTFKWEQIGLKPPFYGVFVVYPRASNYISFDKCHIQSNGEACCIGNSNASHMTYTNNFIETLHNDYSGYNQQDGIDFDGGLGDNKIIGNKIILRGIDPIAHKDFIQFGQFMGNNAKYTTIIANNFLLVDRIQ